MIFSDKDIKMQLNVIHTVIQEQGQQIKHLNDKIEREKKVLLEEINWLKDKITELEFNHPNQDIGGYDDDF